MRARIACDRPKPGPLIWVITDGAPSTMNRSRAGVPSSQMRTPEFELHFGPVTTFARRGEHCSGASARLRKLKAMPQQQSAGRSAELVVRLV
jgi:hypothetical protein